MPLAADLFVQSSAVQSTARRNAPSAASTADAAQSFDDALAAARQRKQNDAPAPTATTVPQRDPKTARPKTKTNDADDASADSADTTNASADAAPQADSSAQTSPKTSDLSTAGATVATKSKPSKDGTPDKAPAVPSGVDLTQVVAETQTSVKPQPPQAAEAETTVGHDAAATSADPASTSAPKANAQSTPQVAVPKTAPANQNPAGDNPLLPADSQKSEASKSVLKPDATSQAKRGPSLPELAAAASKSNSGQNDDAQAAPPQSTAGAPIQPNASPLSGRQSSKFNNQVGRAANTPTAAPDPTATSASTPAPSAAPDAVIATANLKPPAPIAPNDEPPAPSNGTSATPNLTNSLTSTHTSDNRANSAAPAQDSPRAEPDQTFEQIVLGLRTKVDATHSKAEISLNPPNLGTLHVSVSLQNGSLTAQFQSSSDVVRDLLKGNMEKLKSVLESQGVTVDKLAVGAPQDKTELSTATPGTSQTNQSANDGRSAGQYNQQSPNQKRSQDPGSFARAWQQANDKAPIDLVA